MSDFSQYYDNPLTWYLVDTVPDPGQLKAVTILVTSPRRDNYREFSKYERVETFYMPVWNLEEISFCREKLYSDISEETINSRFDKLGGIPRFIFTTDTDPEDLIQGAIQRYYYPKQIFYSNIDQNDFRLMYQQYW